MTKLGIQSALAMVAVLAVCWKAEAQQISILQRTHSILAPASNEAQRSLGLPNVRFHHSASGAATAPKQQRRHITPEMRSILAPPSLQPTNSVQHAAPANTNQVNYAEAYSTEPSSGPITHRFQSDNPVVTADGFTAQRQPIYGFNPYAQGSGTVRQVGGDDILRRLGPPNGGETKANNSFSQISTSDFAELRNAVPLDSVQDPELPSQQETENSNQDPDDTQPRPLPDDLRPPTQLPIPPRDDNPTQPNTNDEPNNADQTDPKGPVVYPDRAYPGRQTYPGPTAKHRPPEKPSRTVPTNPRQNLYQPRNLDTVPPSQPTYPGAVDPLLPNINYVDPIYFAPQPPAGTSHVENYQPVIPPAPMEQAPASDCCEPNGWRPQLAIGADPKPIQNDNCFEPLFYLAAFGGLSDSDQLDGGLPGVGLTSASFNLDNGANFGLAFGQYQGKNLRTEFEYAFRHNDVDSIGLTTNTGGALSLTSFGLAGDIKAHSGMANLVWQFSNPSGRFIRPYIGAGVGFVFIDVNATRAGQNIFVAGQDGNSSFAYQWFAGANAQLTSEMDVFVEYRSFYADDLRLQTNLANVNGGAGVLSSSFNYDTSNVNIGIRFKF